MHQVLWVFGLVCAIGPVWATDATVELTDRERAYLQVHNPITFCADPDWWPFEIVTPEALHKGIAADLVQLVAQRTGVQLQLVPTRTWEETVAASKAGKCRVMSFLNQTPARDQWLLFTVPLLVDPNVLIAREEHSFVGDMGSLRGETIALPKETAMFERVGKDFPHLKILGTDSEPEAIGWVSDRKADLTLRSLIIAAHTIKEGGWFNLKIAGIIPGYENRLRMGVVKAEPILRDILDKGVQSITQEERQASIDRHVPMKVVTDVQRDYTVAGFLAALLLTVLLTSMWWLRKLRALNQQLKVLAETDALTGLFNRHGLYASFQSVVQRAHRYGRPLSVILLDIDHFKRINDGAGHQVGDQVLVAVSALIASTVRGIDPICRWGGEEFLVVCPETSVVQAKQLAERVLGAVRNHSFVLNQTVTLSAGVCALKSGDTPDALVRRADDALYEAKRSGRDRVCVSED